MKLAEVFSDGIVLQRGKPIAVWGTGRDGTRICVELNQEKAEAIVQNGFWKVQLPPMEEGTGYVLNVSDSEGSQRRVLDVAVGEVWIAGGQSNMEFIMKWDAERDHFISCTRESDIRFYRVPKISYEGQLEDEDHSDEGLWRKAVPGDTEYFSAVGFYFALKLREKLGNIPIGILDCNWGGTSAASWMTDEYFSEDTKIYLELREETKKLDFEKEFAAFKERNKMSRSPEGMANLDHMMATPAEQPMDFSNPPPDFDHFMIVKHAVFSPFSAGALFRTMLSKIIGYSVRGVIWYQGEEDSVGSYGKVYDKLFPAMIRCWRDSWKEELPFLFVQLAAFTNPGGIMDLDFMTVRQQQDWVSRTVPNAWMVVSFDVGHRYDIHPKFKRPVGERLALQALAHVYGQHLISESPDVYAVQVKENSVEISLLNSGEGLAVRGDKAEGINLWVNGTKTTPDEIRANENKLTIRSSKITPGDRICVTYAWADWCCANLYNSADLPVRPFCVRL